MFRQVVQNSYVTDFQWYWKDVWKNLGIKWQTGHCGMNCEILAQSKNEHSANRYDLRPGVASVTWPTPDV